MSKTVAYLSGKITGDPDYKQKFKDAEARWTDKFDEIINPASHDTDVKYPWVWYICRDLFLIWRKKVTHIILLKDWNTSPGAKIERIACEEVFGCGVILERHWEAGKQKDNKNE